MDDEISIESNEPTPVESSGTLPDDLQTDAAESVDVVELPEGLSIDGAPGGRNGTVKVTARLNGELLHADEFNVAKARGRATFAAKLCDGRTDIDAKAVEARLLRFVDEIGSGRNGKAAVDNEAERAPAEAAEPLPADSQTDAAASAEVVEHVGGFDIEYALSGRNGTATLTARFNGEPIAVESVNLTKRKAREDFVAQICEGRPGIDAAAVEAELLKLAAEHASKSNGDAPADAGRLTEIDTSRIIRPERFVTSDVSGLAVPSMTEVNGRPVGRWQLYLQWTDGQRESRVMPTSIDLPAQTRLWIHPQPSDPTPSMLPGWSSNARREWLQGVHAPDAAELFKQLCERIAYFLDLPAQHAAGMTVTLALWTMFTYCYLAWDALPYLFVGGPLNSGKTRVFEILARLVFRPLVSSNLTAAALFRTLHSQGGTLLFDEAERLKQSTPDVGEIRSMLLAGYKRGGQATRLEPIGDTFKTVSFDVYGPKALACIAGLPPALASRCIPLLMFRAAPGSEKPRRRIDADLAGWQRLRDDLHALALEHGPTWLELAGRSEVCPTMSGRDFELWQPLLALASWIENRGARRLLKLLQAHALATIDAGKDETTPDADETLLRILADAVRSGERITPHEILAKANQDEPNIFKNWHPRTVTSRLKAYGVPTPRKSGSRREFRDATPELMRRIQTNYGIDLDFPTDDGTDAGEPSQ